MNPQYLDVIKFQQRCHPIRDNCWSLNCPIILNEVETAISVDNLYSPESDSNSESKSEQNYTHIPIMTRLRNFHITRIAWFVVHGWDDPVSIDVGVPSLGCYPKWPLKDGNHRFAAAIIRGDYFILASMSGAINEIQKFLIEDMTVLKDVAH